MIFALISSKIYNNLYSIHKQFPQKTTSVSQLNVKKKYINKYIFLFFLTNFDENWNKLSENLMIFQQKYNFQSKWLSNYCFNYEIKIND